MNNCIACRSTVRPRQEGLQCEECSLWQHRTCTDIPRATYRRAVKGLEVIEWKCSPCTNNVVKDVVMSDEDRPTTPGNEDVVMSDEDRPTLNTSSGFIPMESFRDEQSFQIPEPVTETSLQEDNPVFDAEEDAGPRYTILEGASERGNKKLLDKEGYSYTFRKQNANGNNLWRCTHRSTTAYCTATVIQAVDQFCPGRKSHNHPAEPGTHIAIAIKAQVKLKMDMVMLTEGKISRCQRSRVGQMQARIFSLWTDYNAGNLTTSGLLRKCAFLYGPSADTTPEVAEGEV